MRKRTKEAFSRVKVDALLVDAGWKPLDGVSVIFEQRLSDGTQADYVLCDRRGRPVAVIEAKRASIDPISAQDQALHYAGQLGVSLIFLSNGDEVWFMDADRDAHARQVAGFFTQEDLERRAAVRRMRRDLADVPTDRAIAGRDYQLTCIDTLCREVALGRRKLLVEMATGAGKTRTAAAFIKRLFEAGEVTRVLFLVDRITLATQAEDAFTEHLSDYPSYILRSNRGIDHAKRITIATLQTMINEYTVSGVSAA
jgi:type I restriction enzyme R subunit